MQKNDVTIIGGGLAGLVAGIHLSKFGIKVIVIEKNNYPKHKVCGEYISNEVLPYLKSLDINIQNTDAVSISKLQFSSQNGKLLNSDLPLGGFGISRCFLDNFLKEIAIQNGCEVIQDNVEQIIFDKDEFIITTLKNKAYQSKIAIGAFGKRSNIDQKLDRTFIKKKSHWLAVKAHYNGHFDTNLVGLHHFKGGYCGISKVENNHINVCYIADYDSFKKSKNIEDFQNHVLLQNPHLKDFFEKSEMIFDKPLSISQISFDKKKSVENHILMIGDTAGLIHPLCGNGMAMAIHSAKIASELVHSFLNNTIQSRQELERLYKKQWNINFKKRLKMGRILSRILQKSILSAFFIQIVIIFPSLLTKIIKHTHGKEF